MKRIATADRQVDKLGPGKDGFRASVPGILAPTSLSAVWCEALQEAILSVIERAGLEPSDDHAQFMNALTALFLDPLKAPDGSSSIGFFQGGSGAILQTVQDVLRWRVNAESFQTTLGVMTEAEFDNAVAVAFLRGGGVLHFSMPVSIGSLNIARQRLTVRCGPGVVFTHTGAGVGLSIDAGTVGTGLYDFELSGNPLVIGNAATTDGVFIRAMHHSKIKVRAMNCVTAFRVNFGVCTQYHLICSVNENAFDITPTTGLITDQRGNGEAVQDCQFYVVMEGINGTGVSLNNTNGCEFRATSEGNNKGIVEAATCARNSFHSLDMESNITSDLEISGENTSFYDCVSLSPVSGNNCDLVAARGAKFVGGFFRVAACQPTSADTLFIGVAFSDDASLGITGTGSYKTVNCVKQNTVGVVTAHISDHIGEPGREYTPSFVSSGGAQGAVTREVGTYCRVGPLCYLQGNMAIAKGTLAPGPVSIDGLPFPSRGTANDYQYIDIDEWDNINLGPGYTKLAMRIAPGGTSGTLIKSGDGVPSASVNVADFPDPMNLRFSDSYEVAP